MADAKQGKSPIEDFYNGSSQSRVVLAKPRLGGFGSSSFASSSNKGSCNPFAAGSILRPSQLKPGANPFLKAAEQTNNETETKEKKEEASNEERLKENETQEVEVPKFVPLGSANVTPRTSNVPGGQPAPGSSSGFVFGQNLSERVVMKESVNNGEAAAEEHSSSNGSTELLFTSAAASVKDNVKENQEETNSSEAPSSSDGLAAAAAEYERSHARPPPPTTTYTITGEEGEINVLQISCRLFAWEAGSWRERGHGVLRLNETQGGPSAAGGAARLVARVAGSLRVVLNTKLWPDMVVERAGTKSLRITAADAQQQVKLFLIMASPADIVQLHRALTARIAVSKRSTSTCTSTSTSSTAGTQNATQNATSQKAAERLEADADDNDYLEKTDDVADNEPSTNDRLEADPEHKTEEHESNVDGMKEDKESKSLKRKEPAEDETSPKRQCPEILIE
ncbi:ran-binding protein 3 [Anticarsia gemmatalis]|uniref:ran-binding protein 3 n=1 Tax=Anticarsia gemmatalis TaxID=129554 RepID=UPI003F760C7E